MATFRVGQSFSSFSEFEQCLSFYEKENFVKFCKRTSRKVETAIRSGKTKVPLKPDLIYYEIRYDCIRGGVFRVQGTGKRKRSSCKIECPAHISLRASADGKTLEVKSFDKNHNHEIYKFKKCMKHCKQAIESTTTGDTGETESLYGMNATEIDDITKFQSMIDCSAAFSHTDFDQTATDNSNSSIQSSQNDIDSSDNVFDQKPKPKNDCFCDGYAYRNKLGFHEEWLHEFPFIEYDPEQNLMHCKVCRKFVYDWRKTSPFVVGTDNFRTSMLKYHERSFMHIECQKFASVLSSEDDDLYKEQLVHVFKSVYFIFKNKLPYSHFPQLCESQKKEGADFEVYTTHIKVVPIFGKFIAMAFEQELALKISSLPIFSLIIDASFKRNVESHDLVYIKYLDGFTVQTVFIGVVDSGAKLQDSVYNSLSDLFKKYDIENWADRIAYIMSDRSDSQQWLEGLIEIIKSKSSNFVSDIHYLPHKIKYCGNIVESHKITATLNALIWSLYCYYEKVDKCKRDLIYINKELDDIIKFFGNLPKNFLNILNFETLSAVEKDYTKIIALLQSGQFHFNNKVRKSGFRILSAITRTSFIYKLAILIDIYECLKDFSLKLSNDTLLPYDVFMLIDEVCSDIEKAANGEGIKVLSIIRELNRSPGSFRNIEIKQDSSIHSILPEVQKFAQDVIRYLNSLIDGPLLEKSYIFNISLWPEENGLSEFGNSEFQEIYKYCNRSEQSTDCVIQEWIAFKRKVSEIFPTEVIENSKSVFMKMIMGYSNEFPFVTDVLRKILLLNFECSEIQRGYQEMCLNKSTLRSTLSVQSVQIMMMISMYGPILGEFDSTLAIDLFIKSGNRRFCKKIMDKKKNSLVFDDYYF